MKNTWVGMDPDDIPGYLVDHISTWMRAHDINDLNGFYEHFQSDNFPEDIEDLVEECIKAVLESRK